MLSLNPTRLDDIVARLDAVREFASLPEAASLAAANKRISNILKKSAEGVPSSVHAGTCFKKLPKRRCTRNSNKSPHACKRNWPSAITRKRCPRSSALRDAVDTFFNDVMVNAEDPALRNNRLALLGALHQQMNCVADISKLAA